MREKDLTEGNPINLIIAFALPIFIGNLFQQLYNTADTMIVGYVLGDRALGAVGATSSIYSLIITFINGVCSGFSMTISRFFGAKDEEQIKKAVSISAVLGFGLTVLMTVLGLWLSLPLLRLLNTPEEIIMESHNYIKVLFAFMIFTFAYNLLSGMLRALGNSFMPLVFLVLSVFLNIGLDILFVYSFDMGVGGAALATVLSQAVSAIFCFIYIVKKVKILHIKKELLKIDMGLAKEMSLIGTSIGLSYSVVGLGSVAMQSAINGLGINIITAHTAAKGRIITMTFMPLVTIGTAVATFTSQNLGAGKIERIRKGINAGIKISFVWSTLMLIFVFLAGKVVIRLLTGTDNQEIIDGAFLYLKTNMPFYYPLSLLFIYRQALQGLGNKIVPILSSAIELIGKFAVTFFAVPIFGYLGICFAEPIIWVLCAVVLMFMYYAEEKKILRSTKLNMTVEV